MLEHADIDLENHCNIYIYIYKLCVFYQRLHKIVIGLLGKVNSVDHRQKLTFLALAIRQREEIIIR